MVDVSSATDGTNGSNGSGSNGEHRSSGSQMTLHEAAERLGVHYMTIYRYVRLGLLPAHKEGGSWRVTEADLDAFRAGSVTGPSADGAPWKDRLEARMIAGDTTGAWQVVEAALTSGAEPADVYTDILTPALASIGDRWADGDIGVEQEHLASAVAGRLIGRLGPRFSRRGRPRGTVVTAMPSGERHGFGVTMLADIIRGAGYTVLDLGPDTPAESIVAAIARIDEPSGVCISIANSDARAAATAMIGALREVLDPGTPVIVGGRAADEVWAREAGADIFTDDPKEVVGLLERHHQGGEGPTQSNASR